MDVIWTPAKKPPELGRPEQIEPDLVVRQSPPVLVIRGGIMEIATYNEETDPTDPDYRRLYWANDLDCVISPDYWAALPKPPKEGEK